MRNTDEKYMKMALSLARKGAGRAAPNPMVGCVIVKNGRVIASGYHKYFGGPHAEPDAIGKLAGTPSGAVKLRGSALYVNLEPCRHTNKKTPPCVPLIIKSGIKKVVAGMKDPNPSVSGKGLADLRRAGVATVSGILQDECCDLNKVYVKNISRRLPYVTIKSAMTLDGKIAASGGDSKWISSVESRRMAHRLRLSHDAVLVGAGTVVKDNPLLNVRLGRRQKTSSENPLRVAIDPSGRIPVDSNIFDASAKTIVVTTAASAKHFAKVRRPFVAPRTLILERRGGGFDFKKIMKKLFEAGIKSVLVEGGGETNWNAIKSGVVDEYVFFVAPKIAGGRNAKTPVEGEGFRKISSAVKLRIKKTFRSGPDVVVIAAPVKNKSEVAQ
ncbi:MAG: riboflavin biosynthesis protein RibD [Elusimicrobia bacterium HGW-Elusimicrobia-1]|jgi:diaminohydroxyphosphoribosylaminopyrimidine deaminase/5-amino-6-(5-phosphoribosylamino)uracil reductase|nr:MAG: riboflavin biosynthesis protein RibD [Elusimicrobia bacterium HGW-Elusimicrobia-1]